MIIYFILSIFYQSSCVQQKLYFYFVFKVVMVTKTIVLDINKDEL